MTHPRMPTRTRPELKFFLYSDPKEAKKPDNKRQVRIHVARNSHAKTRIARTKTTKTHGEDKCTQAQAHGSKSGAQTVRRTWSLSPPMSPWPRSPYYPSGTMVSPYPPGVMVFDASLPTPSHPSLLAWVPSAGLARSLVQTLTLEEQVLLDHYVTVQVSQWRSKYEDAHHALDLPGFRHGMVTQLVTFCLTDPGLVQAILLVSSQVFSNLHYSSGNEEQGRSFEQRSFQHRGRLLRDMAENMPHDPRHVTDAIIAKGLYLTFNEYLAGNITDAVRHLEACNYMIEMKGGIEALGLNGFLAILVKWSREEIYAAMNDTSFTTA